jgi:general stress protein YciG
MSVHDRGFASMPPDQRAAISRKGGFAAHKIGHAYEWTVRAAMKAGRKGGIASGVARRRKREEAEKASQPKE